MGKSESENSVVFSFVTNQFSRNPFLKLFFKMDEFQREFVSFVKLPENF